MPEVEFEALKALIEKFDKAPEIVRAQKGAFLEEAGDKLLVSLRGHLAAKTQQKTGKVSSWQEKHIGSRKGYVAVRPQEGEDESGYAFGYITDALEHGHKIRSPSGTSKQPYRPRIKVAKVAGRGFYKAAQADAESVCKAAADEFAEKIAKELEK